MIAFSAAVAWLVGCGTDKTISTTTTSDSTALTTAQCTYLGDDAAAQACFTAFDTCKVAANANIDDCLATLKSCLPAPPQRGPGGGGPMGDGGDCSGGHMGGDHGPGGGGPPPGGGDGGVPDGNGGGHGQFGHAPPFPDSAAVEACHTALDTCLRDVSQTAASCFSTDRDCDKAAFQAAFTQFCTDAEARCAQSGSNADECARITQRCTEGVSGPPGMADGGCS
jgi:hypothetical protein